MYTYSQHQIDAFLAEKQDEIDEDNKLDYSFIDNAPTIPTKTSDLTNDSNFVTMSMLNSLLANKQNLLSATNKLPYTYVSGTPTKVSDFTNDSNFTTKTYVDNLVGDINDVLAQLTEVV